MKATNLTAFIWRFLSPHKGKLSIFIMVACIWAITLSAQSYFLKMIFDAINNYNPIYGPLRQFIMLPIMLYIGSMLVLNLSFRLYDIVRLYFLPVVQAQITCEMMEYIEGHSFRFFQHNLSGTLANQIQEMSDGIKELVKIVIDKFFSHILALVIAAITLSTVNPLLAIMLIIWAFMFIIGTVYASKKYIQPQSEAFSKARSSVVGHLIDSLTNILSIQLFAQQQHEINKIKKVINQRIQTDQKLERSTLVIRFLQGLSVALLITLMFIVLIIGYQQGVATIGDFVLTISLAISLSDAIWHMSEDFVTFSEVLGQCSQALTLMTTPHEIQSLLTAKDLIVEQGAIDCKNISFKYEGRDTLFEDFSLSIAPCQKVGIVGFSGSGKSSFINLLLRFFDPHKGTMYIDGQLIQNVTLTSLRKNISVIPQDPLLFCRSIYENITYGTPEASYEMVIEAAKKAHAHEFILSFPQKYETLVGERGCILSSGQRQRIAIARAFLKNTPLLILDEATSALDPETEGYIQASISNLIHKKTVIVIAHRLSTLSHMDRILVFDNGQIIEDGSPQDLLQNPSGTFRYLWDTQVNGFVTYSYKGKK